MHNLRNKSVNCFGLDKTKKISYLFNSQGFRDSKDFLNVPDYAIFGPSLVFGIGVNLNKITSSYFKNAYNFGIAGSYSNHDIYEIISRYRLSQLYSAATKMCVVWTDRNQEYLIEYIDNLADMPLYHFFCGSLIPGKRNFKFIKSVDLDVSGTHMGPKSHKYFAKVLCTIFNQ